MFPTNTARTPYGQARTPYEHRTNTVRTPYEHRTNRPEQRAHTVRTTGEQRANTVRTTGEQRANTLRTPYEHLTNTVRTPYANPYANNDGTRPSDPFCSSLLQLKPMAHRGMPGAKNTPSALNVPKTARKWLTRVFEIVLRPRDSPKSLIFMVLFAD